MSITKSLNNVFISLNKIIGIGADEDLLTFYDKLTDLEFEFGRMDIISPLEDSIYIKYNELGCYNRTEKDFFDWLEEEGYIVYSAGNRRYLIDKEGNIYDLDEEILDTLSEDGDIFLTKNN